MRKLMISLCVAIMFGAVAASVTANEATIKYRQGHLAAMGGHTNAVFQLFGETQEIFKSFFGHRSCSGSSDSAPI